MSAPDTISIRFTADEWWELYGGLAGLARHRGKLFRDVVERLYAKIAEKQKAGRELEETIERLTGSPKDPHSSTKAAKATEELRRERQLTKEAMDRTAIIADQEPGEAPGGVTSENDAMRPYGGDAVCRMCGEKTVTTRYSIGHVYAPDDATCKEIAPHLHRTCTRCGFAWPEATVEASKNGA